MRTFIAIELPATLHAQIAWTQRQLRAHLHAHQVVDCLNWSAPDKMHITLRFLGETTAAQSAQLAHEFAPMVKQQRRLSLGLQGVGCFPNFRTPNVVWLGLMGAVAELQLLQTHIERLVQAIGFVPESRPFSPHLTIARAQRNADRTQLRMVGEALRIFTQRPAVQEAANSATVFDVTELVYMQSELRPEGARYTPLHHFVLGG